MKIDLYTQVRLTCDGCGALGTLVDVAGLDELDRHETALRAVARVAADDSSGEPPCAWLLDNLPLGWRATVIHTPSPKRIKTYVACSQVCTDVALGRTPRDVAKRESASASASGITVNPAYHSLNVDYEWWPGVADEDGDGADVVSSHDLEAHLFPVSGYATIDGGITTQVRWLRHGVALCDAGLKPLDEYLGTLDSVASAHRHCASCEAARHAT